MKHPRIPMLLCTAAVAAGLVFGLIPVGASALSSVEIQSQIEELEEQNQQLQEQIDALEQQKQDNDSDIQQIVLQKSSIDQQVTLLNAQIRVTEEQIAAYADLIADKQAELDAVQTRFETLSEKNRERIRAMEENGALTYWSVLFKADSFSDLLDRLNMIEEIAAADQRRLEEMDRAAKEVSGARDMLTELKSGLEQTRQEQSETEAQLQVKRQESDALLAQLVEKGDEYQQYIDEGEERLAELMLQLAQKETEYTEALQREWEAAHPATEPDEPEEESGGGSGGGETYSPESSGGWVIPCSYVCVSSPFDPNRLHPILGYVRPHNGIDLAANQGTPVYASRSGTVTVADYEWDGAGNYVFINHGDGFSSVYMHMDYYIVGVGDYVSAGEVIGYVGTTGLSEGPHLHFGIAYNGTYVNPANYIDF